MQAIFLELIADEVGARVFLSLCNHRSSWICVCTCVAYMDYLIF